MLRRQKLKKQPKSLFSGQNWLWMAFVGFMLAISAVFQWSAPHSALLKANRQPASSLHQLLNH